MSLGSRIVTRGRVPAFANLASAPREPFLFLYPSWVRNSSTAAKPDFSSPIPFSTHINPEHKPHDWFLKGGAKEVHLAEADSRHNERASDRSHSNDLGQLNECQVNEPKAPIRRILQSEQKIEKTRSRKRTARLAYQEQRRARMESWTPDWRLILSDLSKNMPKYETWLDRTLNIIEPEDAKSRFMEEIDCNIWDIAERYDCLVTLDSRDEYKGSLRSYFLSGTPTAIRNTALDLLRVSPNAILKARRKTPDSIRDGADDAFPNNDIKAYVKNEIEAQEKRSSVRIVPSENKRKAQIMRADKIPWPAEWTPRSFAEFVTNLTSLEMPNHMHRILYKTGEDHIAIVLGILNTIFLNPDCRSSISRKAINSAMSYFVKTNQITELRRLYVHLEMMNIALDVKTFNIMLRGAAKSQDCHVFHFILHLMLRRGISPNSGTWVAFMMTPPDVRIKLHILSTMRERGLLRQISTMSAVCTHLVPYEINDWLKKGQNDQQLLHHMDSRYGPKWLTLSNANAILDILGSKGLISRCWEFLQIMKSRLVKPDAVSYSIILNSCKSSMNVGGAIEFMKNLSSYSTQSILNEKAYHDLFELAWRSRCYNLARVVWRYACLNASTTRQMRSRVQTSLLVGACQHTEAANARQRWNQQAGFFIMGRFIVGNVSFDSQPLRRIVDDAGRDTLDTQQGAASSYSPLLRQAINLHLEDEYSVFRSLRPALPLSELLVKAWELDKEWKKLAGTGESQDLLSLTWKLANGISVPIRDSRTHSGKVVEARWK